MTNQQAITILKNLEQSLDGYCELNDEGKTAFRIAITAIEQKQKTGHWKHVEPEPEIILGWMPWYCSECGVGVGKHQTAFCPNCGTNMRGGKE